MRLSLTDTEDQDIAQYFRTAIAFMEQAHKEGGKVLVHCHEGKSRSVTLVLAYLMQVTLTAWRTRRVQIGMSSTAGQAWIIPLTAAVLLFGAQVSAWLHACGLQDDAWQPACLCLEVDARAARLFKLSSCARQASC